MKTKRTGKTTCDSASRRTDGGYLQKLGAAFAALALLSAAANADDSLQLCLPFSGHFLDTGAASRTVTVLGNASLSGDRNGLSSKACALNGQSGCLSISPSVAGSPDFTIALWVYVAQPLTDGAYYCLIQTADATVLWDRWTDRGPGHHLDIAVYPGRNGTSSAYWYTLGGDSFLKRWTHVSVVGTATGTTRVFIDGQEQFNLAGSYDGGMTGYYDQTRIGAVYNGRDGASYSFLNGSVDEVRVYDRALSTDELLALPNVTGPDLPPQSRGLWAYGTGDEVTSSPALGLDGTVYIGSADGKFYAFAGGPNLQLPGQFDTGGPVYGSPTIGDDGTIFIPTWSSKSIHAFAKGSNLTAPISSRAIGQYMWTCPTIGPDGAMYFVGGGADSGTSFLKLLSSDPQTWNQSALWNFIDYSGGGGSYTSPALGKNGLAYFSGCWSHRFVALKSSDWSMAWQYPMGESGFSSPAIGTDGTVYVGCANGILFALDGSNGALRWSFAGGKGQISSSPAVSADNTVYLATGDGTVYARDGQTGAERWHFSMGGGTSSSPLLAADGTLYMGAGDRYLYALDAANGALKWKFKAKGPINQSAPMITPEGVLYFGTGKGDDGKGWVHAVLGNSPVGLADAPWPMFKQNAQHTGRQKGLVLNHAPTVACPQPGSMECGDATGYHVQVQATVTDPDAGTLTVTLKEALSGGPTILATKVVSSPATSQLVTFDPVLFALGTHQLTIEVNDGSLTASCSSTVTIAQDTMKPTITPPAAVTVNTDPGQCQASAVALGTPVTADNCGVASVVNNAPAVFQKGPTTVTWTVKDNAGNTAAATQIVTVIDNQPPTIVAPAGVVANTDAGQNYASSVALGTPTTADNCGVASFANDAPAHFPQGATTITWTVTDTSGNTATATQTVTVKDNEPPTIIAPADVVVNTDSGQSQSGTKLTPPFATDNSGIASITSDAPATFPVGSTVVHWSVTDTSGNVSTVTQTVTVRDVEKPGIIPPVAPAPVHVDTGLCFASRVNLGSPTCHDNCGVGSVVNDAPTEFPKGSTIVTWTVTDTSGNTATATQTVMVIDAEEPTITPPAAVTVSTAPGQNYASSVALGTPTTADNCGVASFANDAPAHFPQGTTTVTWTVTDSSGNTATATQLVTVEDHENPKITCPADVTVTAGASGSTPVTWTAPTATDNCGVQSVTCIPASGSPFSVGSTIVKCLATDTSGNSAECSFTVTVQPAGQTCETIQASADRARVHFDQSGVSQFAFFRGDLRFTGGDLAPDFRKLNAQTAKGTLSVTIGDKVVYSKADLAFGVRDNNGPADDREKWEYNSGPTEKMFLRWKDDQQYDATRDPNLPASAATGYRNLGKLETCFITTEETRFRYEFKNATKPITITVDGLVLLTINANGKVNSPFPYWQYGKAVEVLFPDRLVPGNEIAWFADGDLGNNGGLPENLIYKHDAAASGNATDTYFNAGGRFFVKVPVTGLNLNGLPQAAKVEFSIGERGVTSSVGCGTVSVPSYTVVGKNWKFNDGDDDCESEE